MILQLEFKYFIFIPLFALLIVFDILPLLIHSLALVLVHVLVHDLVHDLALVLVDVEVVQQSISKNHPMIDWNQLPLTFVKQSFKIHEFGDLVHFPFGKILHH